MSTDLLVGLLGVTRVLTYVGFVLLAGAIASTSLLWNRQRPDRPMLLLAVLGIGALAAATVGGAVARLTLDGLPAAQALGPDQGAALLVRLAILAGAVFFLVDLAATAVAGWRRTLVWAGLILIGGTIVVESDDEFSWIGTLLGSAHVLAVGVWLGVLVAIVIRSRRADGDLAEMLPRCTRLTLVAVGVLVVTGIFDAFDASGGYVALAVKAVLLAGVLVARHRAVHSASTAVVAVRIELALAVGALAATSVLVR